MRKLDGVNGKVGLGKFDVAGEVLQILLDCEVVIPMVFRGRKSNHILNI